VALFGLLIVFCWVAGVWLMGDGRVIGWLYE